MKCCLLEHSRHPFHRIQEWTGFYFAPTTLTQLGYLIHLGHGGSPCPVPGEKANATTSMVVIDIGQVYSLKVCWCKCDDAPIRPEQLIDMKLYSASVHIPRTAFTERLLEYYHIDATECKTSTQSFYTKLQRLTNKYHPETVPVCVTCHIIFQIVAKIRIGSIQRTGSSITTVGQHPGTHGVWIWS